MKIAIGADHGGFELKEIIKKYLQAHDIEFIDLGNHIYDAKDDYPDYAKAVAKYVSNGEADRGIIVCGSGVGANIIANKFKGIRAAICHDTYSAHQGVEHDNMNILCLGGRIIGQSLAGDIVNNFINANFTNEERHLRRLSKLIEIEKNFK